MLRAEGYSTACFGEWHLGHHNQFLPLQQGFDDFFSLPYSNDMRLGKDPGKHPYPQLPLMNDNEILRYLEDDQSMLITREYTEHAVDFSKRNKDKPFFVYLAHTMPHILLYVSEDFKGISEIAGAGLPENMIDGHSILTLMTAENNTKSSINAYFSTLTVSLKQ